MGGVRAEPLAAKLRHWQVDRPTHILDAKRKDAWSIVLEPDPGAGAAAVRERVGELDGLRELEGAGVHEISRDLISVRAVIEEHDLVWDEVAQGWLASHDRRCSDVVCGRHIDPEDRPDPLVRSRRRGMEGEALVALQASIGRAPASRARPIRA
jgi:hypothetical protein